MEIIPHEKGPYTNFIKFIALDELVPNYLDPTDLPCCHIKWYHIDMIPYKCTISKLYQIGRAPYRKGTI